MADPRRATVRGYVLDTTPRTLPSHVAGTAIIDATLVVLVVVAVAAVAGLFLLLAWASSTGVLRRWPARLADWSDGRPWRGALVLAVPVAVPLFILFPPGPQVSVRTILVTVALIGLDFAVMWALVSWLMRRERDQQGQRD